MHGQVHVAVTLVEGWVVLVLVIIVHGGQMLQRGHIRRRGYDDLMEHLALRRWRREAAARGDKQRGLHRLWLRGSCRVWVGWVLWGGAHTRPLGLWDDLWRRADPLPCIFREEGGKDEEMKDGRLCGSHCTDKSRSFLSWSAALRSDRTIDCI